MYRPLEATERQAMIAERSKLGGLCACGCGRATKIARASSRNLGDVIGFPHRLARGHRLPGTEKVGGRPPMTREQREMAFWARVRKSDGCWTWTGHIDACGYGRYNLLLAHRISYEAVNGPIPPRLTIDHLCRNRRCVNPDHLECVSIGENVLRGIGPAAMNARKTHCPLGHEYSPSNTWISKEGYRACRTCNAKRGRVRRQRSLALSQELT